MRASACRTWACAASTEAWRALTVALAAALNAQYAGSGKCRDCHAEVFSRWSKTRMANVVRDPRTHPDAIIPAKTDAAWQPAISRHGERENREDTSIKSAGAEAVQCSAIDSERIDGYGIWQ